MKIKEFLQNKCEWVAPEIESSEEKTQMIVCGFLDEEFPEVLYLPSLFELAVKFAKHQQSAIMKAYRLGYKKGNQDLWLIFPKDSPAKHKVMLLELKKPGEKIYKKNGTLKSPHLIEQAKKIIETRQNGWYSDFCIGSNDAKHRIYWNMRECDISPPMILKGVL